MSLGIILLVVGILIAILFSAFLIIYWETVKDVFRIRNHRRKDERLLIDYYRDKNLLGHWAFTRRMSWTNLNEATIRSMGYLKAEKWEDNIRYAGVPIYIRLHQFKKPPEPNKIQSSTLYNVYVSRSVKNFIQGILTKIGFSPMDMKTLAILIPVAIGIAIGMWYFLSGGLK